MYEISKYYYIDYKKLVSYIWIKYNNDLYDSDTYQDAKMIMYCLNNKKDYIDFKTKEIKLTYEAALNMYLSGIYVCNKDYKRCMQLIKADNSRYKRLQHRIEKLLNINDCVFFTLTFCDDCLNNTKQHVRRKYVQRFLKSISTHYVANIDFGETTGREHYHGVCILDNPDDINKWKYGFANAKYIRIDHNDIGKLSHYILKISHHFTKASVKRNYVIYSYNYEKLGKA